MLTGHVDDLLVIGKKQAVDSFFKDLHNTLEIKYAEVGISPSQYLGKTFPRTEAGFEFRAGTDYLSEIKFQECQSVQMGQVR